MLIKSVPVNIKNEIIKWMHIFCNGYIKFYYFLHQFYGKQSVLLLIIWMQASWLIIKINLRDEQNTGLWIVVFLWIYLELNNMHVESMIYMDYQDPCSSLEY